MEVTGSSASEWNFEIVVGTYDGAIKGYSLNYSDQEPRVSS